MEYETDEDLYCPSLEPEEVHERVDRMWDFQGPIPLPNFDRPCQQCHEQMRIRYISYGMRDTGGTSFRTDVLCQCYRCFAKQTYGVPIEPEHAARAENRFEMDMSSRSPGIITRKQLINYLEDDDYDFSHFIDEVTLRHDELVEAASYTWTNVKDIPVPTFDTICPQCTPPFDTDDPNYDEMNNSNERDLRISYVSFGVQRVPRCNVSFRCLNCFSVFSFNVPISHDHLESAAERFDLGEVTEETPGIVDKNEIQEIL
jgi:hypothetical protein